MFQTAGSRASIRGPHPEVEEWVRPTDWLPMPQDNPNQIAILAAVFDHDSNYAALKISVSSGTYDVDWGDGNTSTGVTSGTTAEHMYDFDDAALAGTTTSEGYKQAIIIVTPNTGGATILTITFDVKHSRSGLQSPYVNPWRDVLINAPACTSLTMGASTGYSSIVQRVNISDIGTITNASYMFNACFSLQSLSFPPDMFDACTVASSAFQQCYSLQTLAFGGSAFANVVTADQVFYLCYALRELSFPAGAWANVTSASYCFADLRSLEVLEFPAGSFGLLANATGMFYRTNALRFGFPAGALASVTNASSMFDTNTNLMEIELPTGAFAMLVTSTGMFGTCPNLKRIQNCEIPVSFSVASCSLGGEALDEIYTSLPSVSATITITGNHGAADDDPSIATGKGWTVTS